MTTLADIDEYQKWTASTAIYPSRLDEMIASLGRIAVKLPQEYHEVGEVERAQKALLELKRMGVIDRLCAMEMLNDNLDYLLDGLVGEVGELCQKVKKIRRDKAGEFKPEDINACKGEAGDIFWYMGRIASVIGFLLSDAIKSNQRKLTKRQEEGKLSGSGDER